MTSPLHDVDVYALQFGWQEFWALDDQERARVVATMQVEREIEFVSSYWSTHGEFSKPAAEEAIDEKAPDPFENW